jgi:hypothetical protein
LECIILDLTNCPGPPPTQATPQSQPAADPPPSQARPARRRAWFSARPPSWIYLFDPRQPEAFLAFCSAWCALQLWLWPQEFDSANGLMTRQIGLYGHERTWATVGGIAALLKLAGLASRMFSRWTNVAPGMRASGLFLSIVFWMIVGVSTTIDLPHSLLPVALTGLGIAAAFELAEGKDPRETWK